MADSATVCGCVGVTKGDHHRGDPRAGRQHAVAAQGVHARQHWLRQLHQPLPGPAARRGARFRGRAQDGALRLRAVCRRQAARHPAKPAAEVGAGGAGDLRQRHRLRGLQAGAQLHARHALVRRPRRGSLRAFHQRPRARQHPEGRHVLGDPAHPRRRHQRRRAAPDRRRRGEVQGADGEDHRQPAHRPARRQEGGPAEGVGGPRHAVGPGVHQGRAHGEDVRRHRVLPVRHAGLDRRRHRDGAPVRAALHAAQSEDGDRRLSRGTARRRRSRTSVSSASRAAGRWSSAARPANRSARRIC